jgi:16S rRNA (guanine527-N7)-methyltransferase
MSRTSDAGTRQPPGDPNGVGSGRRGAGDRGAPGRPAKDLRAPLPTRISDTPGLSDPARASLRDGLGAMRLDDLPPAALEALEGRLRLLLAWTAAVNLTSIRDPEIAVRDHVLDSLAAVAPLRVRRLDALLDLGTGGGYPGLPLAIALPARRAALVDSVGKKTAFVAAAIDALGLGDRVTAVRARAEALAADRAHRERWQVVVARAVADLADLAEVGMPLVRVGGCLVAWKRDPLDAELDAAGPAIAALGGGRVTVIPAGVPGRPDGRLVIIAKARTTPGRFPRDPAVRASERRRAAPAALS